MRRTPFYDPQRQTILAGGFARPDSQSALGDQFAFIRYGSSGFPDTLFNGNGRMLQNLTAQADHVNAIVSEVGGTLVAGLRNESRVTSKVGKLRTGSSIALSTA